VANKLKHEIDDTNKNINRTEKFNKKGEMQMLFRVIRSHYCVLFSLIEFN
jgi:hypothetical protein